MATTTDFAGSVGWTQMAGSSAASPLCETGAVSTEAVTEAAAAWAGAAGRASVARTAAGRAALRTVVEKDTGFPSVG